MTAPMDAMDAIDAMDAFAAETLGTEAHLDALHALRARGDVVELMQFAASRAQGRRTFVAVGHAAVAAAARHPALSSSWGTGSTDVPEARADGVPFRAVHMSSGALHASLRSALLPLVGVDAALVARARAAASPSGHSPSGHHGDVDALAFAMRVQRAAMGPRFLDAAGDEATLDHNIALVHRAAFAQHDEPARAHVVTREVDTALLGSVAAGEAASDQAWLMRFAWLTAFVTTELAMVHMLESLADRARIERLRDDVDARARFLEESLRVQSPVARFGRVAVDDVALAADVAMIPRGARVLLSFAAANHDPRVFAQPRAIDLERARAPSFAFGAGEHACVGAPLALAILRAVLDALLDDARIERIDVVARTPLRSHVNRGARACTLKIVQHR